MHCTKLQLGLLLVLICLGWLPSKTSKGAEIVPGTPPASTLYAPGFEQEIFRFSFSAVDGWWYRVQYREALGSNYWRDVEVSAGPSAEVLVTNRVTAVSGFFRVATESPSWFELLTGEEHVASQAGPPTQLWLPEAAMPDGSGVPVAIPANAEAALLGVIERLEQSLQNRLSTSSSSRHRSSINTNAVRAALVPLYIRTLRQLMDNQELENAIRYGLPIDTNEGGGILTNAPSNRGLLRRIATPADLTPEVPDVNTNVLSDAVVTNVMDLARQILAAYDGLVQSQILVDDLPGLDPPLVGPGSATRVIPGDTNAPVTINPEFAKLFLRRLTPTLGQRLAPVSAYLVQAMRDQETNSARSYKSYQRSTINWLGLLHDHPEKLKYFNSEGTEWANQWGFRARLPRFWLVEKHDPGSEAEPYFVKLVSYPALDLSRSGSYGQGYKSGKVMAVKGEVTQEYPLRQGEQRGLNPPDNFITPRSWTAWTSTYGLPITFSAQCWEQDWTRRSDVIEGVRRAAEKAEREAAKKFFDSVIEGFLQELGERMEEEAEHAFEHYRNEIVKKLRDLMKQTAGAESVAEYLSDLLGVDVSTLVAGLNFLFDPSADHALAFMKEAFGPTILALLAGGPVGVVLEVVLNILGKAFEQADNFLDFVKGILDSILDILDTVINLIIELLKFKDFFRDILAMLNGDDLLGTATATLEGDSGNIKFSGWSKDEYRRQGETEEMGGRFTFQEHRDKSVVKAQFDLHRLLQHQSGERKYLVAKGGSSFPETLGYEFAVKTKGILAVEITRWDIHRPFPSVHFYAGGNAYYRTTTTSSSDGTWRRVEVNARPIEYGRTMKVYLKAPGWDQPYAQAGRLLIRVDQSN